MKFSKLALAALVLASTNLFAQSSSLTWPNGENICTGSWSYTKLASCGYADNVNDPLYTDGVDITYVTNTCQNWDSYDVVETTSRSTEWEDSIVAPTSCLALKPGDNNAYDTWISTGAPSFEGPWNGSCTHRNAFRKCDAWHKVRRMTCTYERRIARTTQSSNCGTTPVHTPTKIPAGFGKLVGYHPSCPGAQTAKAPYLTSKASITGAEVDTASFTCSTLDNIPASDDASIRNKFDAYMNLAFELSAQDGQCQLKTAVAKGLNDIANAIGSTGGTALTDDQYELVFPTIDSLNAGCEG